MKHPAFRLLLATAFLGATAAAVTLPASEDSSSTNGSLTAAGHKATTLAVSSSRRAYVYFDLSGLPTNASVRYARLPAKGFASVDVTDAAKAWIATPANNEGLAIAAVPGPTTANLTIGSKEGSSTGYPAELEVELDSGKVVIQGNGGTSYQLAPSGDNMLLQKITSGGTSPVLSVDGVTNDVRLGVGDKFISRGDNSVAIDGALSLEATTFNTNFNANDSTCVFFCNTNSNSLTITLPAASGRTGRIYFIKKVSSGNSVTIATSGGNSIDGVASIALTTINSCRMVMSNGSNWFVISAM